MDGWRADPGDVALRSAAALLTLALGGAAPAQRLGEIERIRAAEQSAMQDALTRQQAAAAEEARLGAQRATAAAALRTGEAATADAANALEALVRRRAESEARLQTRATALAPLLPLIERLSLFPAETLLAVPAPTQTAMTGLLVLHGMARQLETDAEGLRAEQAELDRLTQDMARQERRLMDAQTAQAAQAAGLDRQIAEAQARGRLADDAAGAAARRAAGLASQADSLRGAIAQLEAAHKQDEARTRAEAAQAERQRQDAAAADARRRQVALSLPAGPGLAEPRGQLGTPVAGQVVKTFGEPGDSGPASGISYGAPPAARVTAPCGGRVVFAGPFRSFGQLMIIDCGGGYHFVLAGLDRLDVPVGRPVQGGEPVGVMPGWDPRATGTRPLLYLELRQNGQPINPAPFLRARS